MAKEAVQTVQNWLPGTQDSVWSGLTSYRAPGNSGEQAILRPQEALSSGLSSAPDTLCASLDLAREATAVATGAHGAPLGRENAGHEGALSFATLRHELGELGDIFCPMDAKEQGENSAAGPTPQRGCFSVKPKPWILQGPLGLKNPVFLSSSACCLRTWAKGAHGRPRQLLCASGRPGPRLPAAGVRARPEPPAAWPVPGPGCAGPAGGVLRVGESLALPTAPSSEELPRLPQPCAETARICRALWPGIWPHG